MNENTNAMGIVGCHGNEALLDELVFNVGSRPLFI